jgi:hypothetical protein
MESMKGTGDRGGKKGVLNYHKKLNEDLDKYEQSKNISLGPNTN